MKLAVIVVGLVGVSACAGLTSNPRATADLRDKNGAAVGRAVLVEDTQGVRVRLEVNGLTPGLHAVHVHAVGKCEAPAFTSAGGHFNPANRKHGHRSAEGAHAGDLPNMLVGKEGRGRFETVTDAFTLRSGATSVFDSDGSALVVHVSVDDYSTDPTGNAGDRAACGLIVAAN
jgi:Cu-Zn family superoxide dismutase